MKGYLRAAVFESLIRIGISADESSIQFERPKIAEHGDLSCNIAMVLAREAKKNSRQLAQEISEHIHLDPEKISSIEIAGPGFLNFRFSHDYLYKTLENIIRSGNRFGASDEHAGKRANVEWVSANPTGPLHAGHGRQVCIGATLCSLLEWTGWEVTREYYFNNAGNQMHNLAVTVRERYRALYGKEVSEINIHYAGEYISDIARDIASKHGDAKMDAELQFFKSEGEQWCFNSIKATLDVLNVHHDVFFNEDTLYTDGKIHSLIQELKDLGLSYEKDGAVWLKTTNYGADKDRVIVKSSGEPTYRLPDIAYHRDKILRQYDRIIDIFGADHIATIPDVLSTLQALGINVEHIDVIIHQMVSFVSEGELVKMSKRAGNAYSLNDLVADVGVDAVRYFFVMRAAQSQLEFDITLAQEQSENNPVYYVQYAHARIASIVRFADSEGMFSDTPADLSLLQHDSEIALIKALYDFPAVISLSVRTLETQHVCTYLQNLAAMFHKFYHDCRVVSEDKMLSLARMYLCRATKQVLANGCTIVGISAPEKM